MGPIFTANSILRGKSSMCRPSSQQIQRVPQQRQHRNGQHRDSNKQILVFQGINSIMGEISMHSLAWSSNSMVIKPLKKDALAQCADQTTAMKYRETVKCLSKKMRFQRGREFQKE